MIEVAIAAAEAAAKQVTEGAGHITDVQKKAPRSLVTNVDLAAEKAAIDVIKSAYPDHAILSEEAGATPGRSEFTWVIDPIDGTANFTSGIPFYAVSVAVAREEEIVAAVVIDPVRRERFTAERGSGSFCNGVQVHARPTSCLEDVVIGYDLGYSEERAAQTFNIAGFLRPSVRNLRTLGSAVLGLTYVAAGRFDVFLHSSVAPWDLAAGWLLVEEAGGVVTDMTGAPPALSTQSVLATNRHLLPLLLQAIPAGLMPLPK